MAYYSIRHRVGDVWPCGTMSTQSSPVMMNLKVNISIAMMLPWQRIATRTLSPITRMFNGQKEHLAFHLFPGNLKINLQVSGCLQYLIYDIPTLQHHHHYPESESDCGRENGLGGAILWFRLCQCDGTAFSCLPVCHPAVHGCYLMISPVHEQFGSPVCSMSLD